MAVHIHYTYNIHSIYICEKLFDFRKLLLDFCFGLTYTSLVPTICIGSPCIRAFPFSGKMSSHTMRVRQPTDQMRTTTMTTLWFTPTPVCQRQLQRKGTRLIWNRSAAYIFAAGVQSYVVFAYPWSTWHFVYSEKCLCLCVWTTIWEIVVESNDTWNSGPNRPMTMLLLTHTNILNVYYLNVLFVAHTNTQARAWM